ncbi:cytidine deaminase [Actinobacillus vicugnae]|uniref:cytidine deaminase n=1 Tax=Actinobacillus vicugnae TaxID=2573093 RepID=UPI00123F9FE7|nr:cytidine deaminase [Actinobacillus vicugnae]
MATLFALQARLEKTVLEQNNPIITTISNQLKAQNYRAKFSGTQIQTWSEQFELSPVELALHCLPLAACYALVPVSNFYVGAVAIGVSGNFYFGANQEFSATAMQQTIHAEQSAIMHAWLAGEQSIQDMIVNHTPCGHCRQFMNELNTAKTLKIHLPHSQNNLLHNYLPDSFGPTDLNITQVLFDAQHHTFEPSTDPLTQAAIVAAQQSYAPYSQAMSGIALQVGEQVITGRYAENAAFNPSFLPLQSALNYRRLSGLLDEKITRIVMAEKQAVLSHRGITEELSQTLLHLDIEYIAV